MNTDRGERSGGHRSQARENNPDDESAVTRDVNGAHQIARKLRQAILDGIYSPGEKLPAERTLANHFGAARGTVRQALRELDKSELITRRIGSGTYVNQSRVATADEIAETTSPLELTEARFAVEPHMARLAVVNASSRALRKIRDSVERLESASGPTAFTRADCEFHLLLAECSQNSLIIWLYHHINEVRRHSQWAAAKEKVLSETRMAQYNRDHRNLYLALAARDGDQAARIMTHHLTMAREDLLGVESDMLAESTSPRTLE